MRAATRTVIKIFCLNMTCPSDAVVSQEDKVPADCEDNKSTNANEEPISLEQITDGILALKAAVDWPQEPKTPPFNDEAATVYLNILPKIMPKERTTIPNNKIYLPHPLSMDRRVCVIGRNLESEEQQAISAKQFKDLGVLGKIKTVPCSLLELALKTDAQEALEELTDLYDTYFCNDNRCRKLLEPLLWKKNKFVLAWNTSNPLLNMSHFCVNPESDGYIAQVGHTGLTDQQLQENIAKVARFLTGTRFIFRNGIDSVRSMHLKTGTSEAVCIHQDDSEEGEPDATAAIDYAISVRKTAPSWPKAEALPEFSNYAATVTLRVLPMAKDLPTEPHYHVLCLPHALSLNRSVCYIGQDVETKEKQAEMTEKLKAAGVQGKIRIIPGSQVELAVKKGESESITQLAQLYDTYLVDKRVRESPYWQETLPAFRRSLNGALDAEPSDFATALRMSVIWRCRFNYNIFVRVGHCGLTDQQLRENIAAAIDFFKGWDLFPQGWASIKSMDLRSGTGKDIYIFQDNCFKLKQPRHRRKESAVENANETAAIGDGAVVKKEQGVGKKPIAIAKVPAVNGDDSTVGKDPAIAKAIAKKNKKKNKKKKAAGANVLAKPAVDGEELAIVKKPVTEKEAVVVKKEVTVSKEPSSNGNGLAIVKKKKKAGAVEKGASAMVEKAVVVGQKPAVDLASKANGGKRKGKRAAEEGGRGGALPPKQRRAC